MLISNLPRVLIEEIFARVPLRSLRAVRLTCKNWNFLSKSESFIKMYTSKAATSTREKEESMMIALMNNNLYSMKVIVDDVDPSIEFKRKPSFLGEQVKISQVFHCEGLLLCILKDDDTRVVVWNPYCGQTMWIKLRYSHQLNELEMFCYALGYENSETYHSLKFLRFIDYFNMVPEKQIFWYEIYDLDSGLWTTLDVTPHWSIYCGARGVSLKGKTYWSAIERNSEGDILDHIICFDFTTETFGPLLPLPSSVRDLEYELVTLSCVREEKLAVLFQKYDSLLMEIWITTKINAEMVLWSKFLTIDTEPDIITYISEGFFIDEAKKVAMGFNEGYPKQFSIVGTDGLYFRNLDLGIPLEQNCWPHVYSYVPSLVQIKKPAGAKKTRESSLEKLRFDQNKLKFEALKKPV